MKARVIVTLSCNRNCENCCNKESVFEQNRRIHNIEELLKYDEIIITGGEPMLIPSKIISFIYNLRDLGYEGKFYMYSALYTNELDRYYDEILFFIDGLHFTVHYEATDKEIMQLKKFSESKTLRHYPDKSYRLAIDSRLYDKYDFSNIDFSNWSVVRKLKWLVDCPLPQGEELLIYEL